MEKNKNFKNDKNSLVHGQGKYQKCIGQLLCKNVNNSQVFCHEKY